MNLEGRSETLRQKLREETRALHDRLDTMLGSSDLTHPRSYASFLETQYSARKGIEAWSRKTCPPDQCPPHQAEIIRDDLASLGVSQEISWECFDPGEKVDPLGISWAIAGSSLGNLTILSRMKKAGATHLPTRFLSDPSMPAFWNKLQPEIKKFVGDGEASAAITGASAVFSHFIAASEASQLERAA